MTQAAAISAEPTPVAALYPEPDWGTFAGARTPQVFLDATRELSALTSGCGVFDLGWRTRLRITGEDRVRWLNGMVTNTVKDLRAGQLNYTFLLNAQGRIQGDGEVYATPDSLLFVTDREQALRLAEHLDRFIIMDEVELGVDEDFSALGVAGANAGRVLAALGLADEALARGTWAARGSTLAARDDAGHFTLWVVAAEIPGLWQQLLDAGATPCGTNAVESLRVLEGVPRYGVDMHEKSLAQETGQMRALNFNKGCYLGQEIVERVRSRATVHRAVSCFALHGELPARGTPLFAEAAPDVPVGELTSATSVTLPTLQGSYAIGLVRTEAATGALRYAGGTARALARAPLQEK